MISIQQQLKLGLSCAHADDPTHSIRQERAHRGRCGSLWFRSLTLHSANDDPDAERIGHDYTATTCR